MTNAAVETSVDLPCHVCGYDLRAQPQDGQCPECGTSVAESRRVAAMPRRPAWQDSDPRWRRRVLAGTWVLVLLPLMDVLNASGLAARVPVPTLWDSRGTVSTLDHTLAAYPGVYQPLAFCIGLVLLFSRERGRRPGRLDWTRRWGVLCSYVVLLLSATQFLFIAALVMTGIAALFLAMPLEYQPGVTLLFMRLGWAYLRFGPNPMEAAGVVLIAFSSVVVLLACVPLFDALRSSGSERLAAILLVPLALFSLMYLLQAGWFGLGGSSLASPDILHYWVYFRPELLVKYVETRPYRPNLSGSTLGDFIVEATKWCTVLSIAVWLNVAQVATWRRRKKPSAA